MPISLPQPPPRPAESAARQPYRYLPYDVLESDWRGDPRRLERSLPGAAAADAGRYAPGTLVWVLLSKGKPKQPSNSAQSGYDAQALHKKRRDKKNKRKTTSCKTDGADTAIHGDVPEASFCNPTLHNTSRKEFFLRARVVSDDEPLPADGDGECSAQKRGERRILVRYSKGATYRVRAYNLIPVLEATVHAASLPPLVVVVPETNIYRRVARVHTAPDDSFMEIGCDYGITIDKIRKSLEEAGDVPKEWPIEAKGEDGCNSHDTGGKGRVLGVDRSKESIDLATERYPECQFALGNVLVPEEMTAVRELCERTLVGAAPSVICVDINGNREIDGVLDCVRAVMNEPWKRMPRLIVVKSRFLYWELKKEA
ncbi:hypothetical protein ACHAXT_006532 [Thalassiosira profunda]